MRAMAFLPLARAGDRCDAARMRIEILLFDGFDELDVFGPFEGLADAFDTALVTLEGAREVVSARGVPVRAARALGARPDVLIVPGGGWLDRAPQGAHAEAGRGAVPAAIADRRAAGSLLASVCTGAMLLAEAGVLDGRRATTNPQALDELRAGGPSRCWRSAWSTTATSSRPARPAAGSTSRCTCSSASAAQSWPGRRRASWIGSAECSTAGDG